MGFKSVLDDDNAEIIKEGDSAVDVSTGEVLEIIPKLETQKEKIDEDELRQCEELRNSYKSFLAKNYDVVQQERAKIILPTGLDLLDAISGGGLGMNFIQFVGLPGCGKSMLAAKVLAEGQRRYKPKFLGEYFDSEQSTTKERLAD